MNAVAAAIFGEETARTERLGILLCLLLAVQSFIPVSEWRHFAFLPDDAYISLNYARNLLDGKDFVYNHPPPSLGTTAPLWVVLVAGAGYLLPWVDLQTIAVSLSTTMFLLSAWLFVLLRATFRINLAESCLIGIFSLTNARVYVIGTELPLFSCLLIAAFALTFHRKYYLAGLTVGLLALVRGEGGLVGPVTALMALVLEWHRLPRCLSANEPVIEGDVPSPKRTSYPQLMRLLRAALVPWCRLMGGFLSVWVPWSWYALLSFGQVIPNTLMVKVAQGTASAEGRFLDGLYQDFLNWGPGNPLVPRPFLTGILVAFSIAGLLVVLTLRKRMWPFIAYISLYTIGYGLLGVPAYYRWYRIPVFWMLSCLAALGFVFLLQRGLALPRKTVRAISIAVLLALLSTTVASRWHFILGRALDQRAYHFVQVVDWLKQYADPQANIASMEVGYLGYFTDMKILDLAGLTSPEIARELKSEVELLEKFPADYYLDYTARPFNARLPRFTTGNHTYLQVAQFSTAKPHHHVTLYQRITPIQVN